MAHREARRLDPAVDLRYRPYLDGLRCLAVYLVVAFHAGLGLFSGGFVGVDVFFVLSGFLVTRILLGDLVRSGRIDFRRFYSRRFRRILPAAAVMLLVTTIAYLLVASPLQAFIAVGDFRAAFCYFANWHFVQQTTDYFATPVGASPVLHFWSLAVEEQFYAAWPLLLTAIFLVTGLAGPRRWAALRVTVVVLAVLSAAEALQLGSTQVDRAYFGTDTRAYQLLAGALLALTPQIFRLGVRVPGFARAITAAGLAGIVLVSTSLVAVGPITRGVAVVAVTVLVIIGLESQPAGAAGRLLSVSPFTYLGRISYATYLWHWPVVVLLTRNHTVSPVTLFLVSGIASSVLAALSFRLIEHPIRASQLLDRFRGPVIAVSLAVSLAAGLVLAPSILEAPSATVDVAKISLSVARIPTDVTLANWHAAQADIPSIPDCLRKPATACIVVRGRGKRVLLMGDSLARMWSPTFEQIAKKESLTLAIASFPACPWQLLHRHGLDMSPGCSAHTRWWYERLIPAFNPDVIVLAERAFDAPGNVLSLPVNGRTLPVTALPAEQYLASVSRDDVRLLHRPGRKIVILEPTPLAPDVNYNQLSCLSTGARSCSFRVSALPTPLEHHFTLLADNVAVFTIDFNHLVCPRLPVCDPVVNHMIVRRDHTHLTATYAAALAAPVAARLQARGILAPAA